MRIFVPIEEASLDRELGPLVPYRQGLACVHALRDARDRDDDVPRLSDESSARRPGPARSFSPDLR